MIRCEHATIVEMRDQWSGVQRAWATLEADAFQVSVTAYTAMVGELRVGDRVLVNTNAVRRGLGTGGEAFVIAPIVRDHNLPVPTLSEPAGHMVKARYTPMQMITDAVDDPASPHHEAIDAVENLAAMPVIVSDLHSTLGPIAAGIRLVKPQARIVYLHTDWGALPAAFSHDNARLRTEGVIDTTISVGQSFGGDVEAVTIPSALAAAYRVYQADAVIITQGPGNLGTGSRWGFSGIAAAGALHDATLMGAHTWLALRVSRRDPRPRHCGLSHHSTTVLERMLALSTNIAIAKHSFDSAEEDFDARIELAVAEVNAARLERSLPPHHMKRVNTAGIHQALSELPVQLSTMGRNFETDPYPFYYAALAGAAAVS